MSRHVYPIIAITVVLAASGCAQQPVTQAAAEAKDVRPAPTQANQPKGPNLPRQELTDELLYGLLLAEIASNSGNRIVAAQAFADLAKRTRDPRIARSATDAALRAQMPETALESARIWLETDPQSPEAQRTLTSLLLAANRIEEAEPHLQEILAANESTRADAFMQINRLLANHGDKTASLAIVQRLAATYPDLAQAHFAIAQAAANADEPDLALKEVREAKRLSPGWELAVLYEAQLLQKRSNDEAAAVLATFLESHPQSRDVRLNYARVLVNEKKYEAARGEFGILLKDFPDNTDVLFAVALLSMQLEDWGPAEDYLKRLLALNYGDRNAVRFYLGQVAEEQKRYPEALDWYREVTRGAQYIPAQVRQAQVLSKEGNLDGARKFLQSVNASNNQQRVQLILAEAQLLREAGQPEEAFAVVGRALEKLPDNTDLLYDYAMLAEKIDRIDILESSLRKVISIKPDHAHAYNALGYSLADRSMRLPEARELVEKALALSPDDAFIIDSMGWVEYRLGDSEKALEYLRKAYAERQDPEIAAHLGEVLWATGHHSEAEKVWNEALAKAPDNDTLIKTIKRFKPE
ncbi:MAG: tetratricopeptide repeat protein [Betaproteobacteria bacterium]|nr:tetratricopeptide repeat protein [Betaproteobacteria bacterium]